MYAVSLKCYFLVYGKKDRMAPVRVRGIRATCVVLSSMSVRVMQGSVVVLSSQRVHGTPVIDGFKVQLILLVFSSEYSTNRMERSPASFKIRATCLNVYQTINYLRFYHFISLL